jgi:hypothetical protein
MSGKVGYRKFIIIPEDQYLQQNAHGFVEKTVEPEEKPQSSGNAEKTVEEQKHSEKHSEKAVKTEQQEGDHMTEGSRELRVAIEPQEEEDKEGEGEEIKINGPLKYYPTGGSVVEYPSNKKDDFVWLRPY